MTGIIRWTVEETDFISCYWKKGSTKQELQAEIQRTVPYMGPEMQDFAAKVMEKLNMVSEMEYREMVFFHSSYGTE
ncbi:MAG: transposon-transfer assisting family protein [Lachnospiraceae bacterium]|nr:transposon-transfer assisting family protein [Lachnospiraceae bacterium]